MRSGPVVYGESAATDGKRGSGRKEPALLPSPSASSLPSPSLLVAPGLR